MAEKNTLSDDMMSDNIMLSDIMWFCYVVFNSHMFNDTEVQL
jgi:hypothetical protein